MKCFQLFGIFCLFWFQIASANQKMVSKKFEFGFNRDFINMTIDPKNATHLGAIKMWVLKEIRSVKITINLISATTNRTFIDQTLYLCRLKRQLKNNIFLKHLLDQNKIYFTFDIHELRCPFKKVIYLK